MHDSIKDIESGEINTKSLSIGKTYTYQIDENLHWPKSILDELEENIDEKTDVSTHTISSTFSVTRKSDQFYKDHLIIKGDFQANFETRCIKCLKPMFHEIEGEFAVCFLGKEMESMPEFKDSTEIYYQEEELELYFYEKGKIDLYELIHEQIFMNVDDFPLHDEDCKGLCHVCGVDLNNETCTHQAQQNE